MSLRISLIGNLDFIVPTVDACRGMSVSRLHRRLPDSIHEFFRGGNHGGVIIGLSILCGLLGMVLYPINIIFKRRKFWGCRLFLVMLLFVEMAFLGSMV